MAVSIIKFYETTSERINDLTVEDGQIIFCTDLQTIYLDLNGMRYPYSIAAYPSEEALYGISNPAVGFYFTDDTKSMWRYADNTWTKIISGENATSYVYKESYLDFPPKGEANLFYVDKDGIYRWNEYTDSYQCISNITEWKRIGE